MTVVRTPAARMGRVFALVLGVAVVTAVAVYAVGGMSWLQSPAVWGVVLVTALMAVVAARIRRHPTRSLLLGLPVVVGGAAAICLGAWDYGPWLTSPATWLGILVSAVAGAWLVGTGRARPREVVEGIVVGLVVFGLAVIAVFAGVAFLWMVWRPLG